MIPFSPESETGLCAHDALLLRPCLQNDVVRLLPVPASVDFCFHAPAFHKYSAACSKEVIGVQRSGTAPFVQDNILVIPLVFDDPQAVDVVVFDVDPLLLQKMDAEWLVDLQQTIIRQFLLTRQRFIDPASGLYNQRAFTASTSHCLPWRSMFLVALVSPQRSVTGGYQHILQLSSLLGMAVREPLFCLGQGIFAFLCPAGSHKATCQFARRLIKRLKREKLAKIHVGFSLLPENSALNLPLANCWEALSEAERRGPYSLCDAASLQNQKKHPFSLPEPAVLRSIQRRWCGLDRFGLALFSYTDDISTAIDLRSFLVSGESCFMASTIGQFVIFADATLAQTEKRLKELADIIQQQSGQMPAVGYCIWPAEAGRSKLDCIRKCRKAILHGSFYGEGAVVAFDFVSLHVSGDFYFDDGDYKQAIREYRLGLQQNPNDPDLLNSLGVALAEVNQHREAVSCFSRVLATYPDNHMALVNKGMSCRLLGQQNTAVKCFEKALQSKEKSEQISLELYLQLSHMYCLQEKYGKAVVLLQHWQDNKGEPEESVFFKLMGEACLGSGNHKKAIYALQRSLQLYPHNPDSLSMLGLLYVLEGEGTDIGLSLCEKAITMDESEPEHLFRLARAYFHAGRYEEALAGVRKVILRQKNNGRAVLLRADIYSKLGLYRKALQSYRRVLVLDGVGSSRRERARAQLVKIKNNNLQ